MSDTPKLQSVHAGFIPLVDSAPLVVAKELGFATQEGISLHLHREVSWANIRDKLNVGLFDCAHMLAPMPLAATLGIGHVRQPVIVPVNLSLNGNAFTVSRDVFSHMLDVSPGDAVAGGKLAASALRCVIEERKAHDKEPLTFGVVYPFSCHNYELRFWLSEARIEPDRDVRLVVLPPSLMADSLEADHIQGFCAGEPWNSVAVDRGLGRIIATKRELWGLAPEKVLGVRFGWGGENPEVLGALIRSIVNASEWLDVPSNRIAAAALLARSEYLNLPQELLERALTASLVRDQNAEPGDDRGYVLFSAEGGSRPSVTHALWLLTQMVRWGQLGDTSDLTTVANKVSRIDLFDEVMGAKSGATNAVEDQIRARLRFDPDEVDTYIADLSRT